MPKITIQDATLRNAFSGESLTFSGSVDDTAIARMDIRLESGGGGGADALPHLHPLAEESFAVRSGRITVAIDDVEHEIGPGERITVPRGRSHWYANAGDDAADLVAEFRPAQDFMRFFANFAMTTQKHPEWFSAKGEPPLLLLAMILHAYRDHLYLTGIPLVVQRTLFAFLAPIARLRGYRLEIPPRA